MKVPQTSRRRLLTEAGSSIALGMPERSRKAAATALRGPVDVERRRDLLGRPLSGFSCPNAGPPVRDLDVAGAYIDPSYSVIDPEKFRKMMEVTRPLGTFSIKIAQLSDTWLLSQPPQSDPAACALTWLNSWAAADAMLGQWNTPDAQHQRRWTLCGLALAYLKIQHAPNTDEAAKVRIEKWFSRLADATTAYYGRWSRQSYNNHIYWWALALAATGVATQNVTIFEQGVAIYRSALDDIRPDGTLPLEMSRKGRALLYHIFALTPLVMIAEIGEANDIDLYADKGGAIHRLADRVLAGTTDPAWFSEHAGAPQENGGKSNAFTFVWAEPYFARFPSTALGREVAERRPLFNHWLGGSTTYDFGSPVLPFRH
jgi:poly(beta-D-mannuronate) lyase